MNDMITSAIILATEVLKFINTEEALAYVKQLNDAQTELLAEMAKGYDGDDAKIENLQLKIGILMQTVQNQLTVFTASKSGSSPTATPPSVSAAKV